MSTEPVFNAGTVYISDQRTAPKRRYWIYHTGVSEPAGRENNGWAFVVDELDESGDWQPVRDSWEEWFFQIMRYPPSYSQGHLIWRKESTKEVISLEAAQLHHDGKRVSPEQTLEEAGLSYLPADWRR